VIAVFAECLEQHRDSLCVWEISTVCLFLVSAAACSVVTVAEAMMPVLPKAATIFPLVTKSLHVKRRIKGLKTWHVYLL
jgi:hypothetical protein